MRAGPRYDPPYKIRVFLHQGHIQFEIDDLIVYSWHDQGTIGGPALGAGSLGFRQMAPLIAEYANLQVHVLNPM